MRCLSRRQKTVFDTEDAKDHGVLTEKDQVRFARSEQCFILLRGPPCCILSALSL